MRAPLHQASFVLLLLCVLLASPARGFSATHLRRPVAGPINQSRAETFNLLAYGAAGDGVSDDGPALQRALGALKDAGGGTLFVPSGSYAIRTPVNVDFAGRASGIKIQGVPSSTPPAPEDYGGELGLSSEFIIAVGEEQDAMRLSGLDSLLIEDLAFIGVQTELTDARITLNLSDIKDAMIHRSEFYGLASLVAGGAIVQAHHCGLALDGDAFLGCATSSSMQSSLVQNSFWTSISVKNSKFIDYGSRPDFYSKTVISPPYSWIAINSPAPQNNLSPRREAVIQDVILDEGALMGLTCLPSAPADLLLISNLRMNVSNLGAFGVYIDNVRDVLIEDSHFGWSHNAGAAILLGSVDEAILDNVECVAGADHINAGSTVRKLTVINSTYNHLDSAAQATTVTNTTAEDDPAHYLKRQYYAVVGHAPDPAAEMFWTSRLAACDGHETCMAPQKEELESYLKQNPSPTFNLSGQVFDEHGNVREGVTLSLAGLQQALTARTSASGDFIFAGLPTSGRYVVTPSQAHFVYVPEAASFELIGGDRTINFQATEVHSISGRVTQHNGPSISGVTVTLTGSRTASATTDINGDYSFQNLPASGDYTVTPSRPGYTYRQPSLSFQGLGSDQRADLVETLRIGGRLTDEVGFGIGGVVLNLSGSANLTTTTDALGNYSFLDLPEIDGYGYVVAPVKSGYSFSPQNRIITAVNYPSQQFDFKGMTDTPRPTHSVRGRVTGAGVPLSGVEVALGGSQSATTRTDSDGNYRFTVYEAGSYVISVAATDFYTFISQQLVNPDSDRVLNFAGTPRTYRLSGQVSGGGVPLSGLTIKLSGSADRTTTTNEKGEYLFDNVVSGGNYTLAPLENPFYSFGSQSFQNLNGSRVQNFTGTLKRYSIGGRVLDGQSGLAGTSVRLTGYQLEKTTLTDSNGVYTFTDLPAMGSYTVGINKTYYTFIPATRSFNNLGADGKADFAAQPEAKLLSLSALTYSASEGAGSIALTVRRTGDPASAASVDYRTSDGTASQRTDYTTASGTLSFAPGETSKTFNVSLIDNAFVDGNRSINLILSNAVGAMLGQQAQATLTITDNDTAQPALNPIDNPQFFVRQQYLDFLNREPDAGGLSYWSNQVTKCSGADPLCVNGRRVAVADAFFFEPEFQQTGAFVYRVYKAAFGARPTYAQFIRDRGRVLAGSALDQSKNAFSLLMVQRDEFTGKYPRSLTAAQFVDALLASLKQNPNLDLSSQRGALLNLFDGTDAGRAAILRQIADAPAFVNAEYNQSFVLMEYFGYLRRDPDQGGFDFWLAQVNRFPLRDVATQNAMACSFITSAEYQTRFSTVQTTSNRICPHP